MIALARRAQTPPQLLGAVVGAFRALALTIAAIAVVILAAVVWHIASHSITGAELQAFIAPTSLDTQSRSIEQLVEGAR